MKDREASGTGPKRGPPVLSGVVGGVAAFVLLQSAGWCAGFVSFADARPLLVRIRNASSEPFSQVSLLMSDDLAAARRLRPREEVTLQLPRRRPEGALCVRYRRGGRRHLALLVQYLDSVSFGAILVVIADGGLVSVNDIVGVSAFGRERQPWLQWGRPPVHARPVDGPTGCEASSDIPQGSESPPPPSRHAAR